MISVACLLVYPFSVLGQTERTSDQRPSAMAPPDWLFPTNPTDRAKPLAYHGVFRVPHSDLGQFAAHAAAMRSRVSLPQSAQLTFRVERTAQAEKSTNRRRYLC
jgi:hypothetical protein